MAWLSRSWSGEQPCTLFLHAEVGCQHMVRQCNVRLLRLLGLILSG
jgi:hypothetical protein